MAYIDKETTIKELEKMPAYFESGDIRYGIIVAIDILKKQTPTADAVEVRHGEWLYHECVSSYDGAISGYSCSHCGVFVDEEEFENDKFHKKFCGNCGAKMDGKDGE